tara:strand:- start:258 stop:2204 length:1947 start_codon:yes stop_codon:yes gene_type:complete
MFEAVSNAFHSIEERWGDDLEGQGRLEVLFDAENKQIQVSDNGIGFDDNNLSSFLTPLTGKKFERGGKGFGRFMAFKVFKEVYYSSKQTASDQPLPNGVYLYDPFSTEDNLVRTLNVADKIVHDADCGVAVMLGSPLNEYEDYFKLDSKDSEHNVSAEDVVAAVLDHFLIEFLQKKVPKHFILTIQDVPFNLYQYFNDGLSIAGEKAEFLPVGQGSNSFEFTYYKVGADQAKKHRLYFYANNRAASEPENISSNLNKQPFSEIVGQEEKRYYYLVAVSSEFFKSSQSRDRITNLHGKIEFDGKKKSIKDHLISLAKKHILEIEAEYTAGRRKKMKEDVDHLIAIDPLLRRGLGNKTSAEFVRKRAITETREQLASDLFIERFRRKFDFSKLATDASLDKLVSIVRTQIPEDAKEALAVYVAYRNQVIRIFRELLKKQEEGLATEDQVHQLIYPRYKDSEEVDFSSHNLWLLDDDLAYARYISSDRTTESAARNKGEYAHDLLINNENELMIVEMKRPQKKSYDGTKEESTNNPIDQLKRQVSAIRKKQKVLTSGGREVQIPSDSMVRGYILADWNDSLQTYLEQEDFIITNFGGRMAYRYYNALNIMIEVLAFDRLVDRACNRNEAFVQMLDGRSNYDRIQNSPLSSD